MCARLLYRCVFQSAVSAELIVRLGADPRLRDALDAMPPKMISLSSGRPSAAVAADASSLENRVEQVVARLESATFTGKGDREVVPRLYKEYASRLADSLQPILALPLDGPHTGVKYYFVRADKLRATKATTLPALQ